MSYCIGVDIGTSRIRCVMVGKDGQTLAQKEVPVHVIHPTPDGSEIDPEELWEGFKKVVHDAMISGSLKPKDAVCLGITTLRCTFLLWERESGQPLCNFSTWQDRRAAQDCIDWNKSMQMKFFHTGANIAHFFTRNKRFMAASVIKFITNQVNVRLWWTLNRIDGSRERAKRGELCFGTVDTWILWKLTNGQVHATDYSNVSGTAIYDTYQLDWSGLLLSVFDIPREMLPEIRDSGGSFGRCAKEIFGASIPITGVISDQTSATFAQMCWEPGDVKCTIGTGMFININTGRKPHASVTGFYPVIGWKIGTDLTFLAEGMFSSIGSVVEWGKRFGLFEDPSETEKLATSVDSSAGVCFVPCFDGIQAPHNDPQSTGSIIGITHNTKKPHVVRAMLESFAFIGKQLFDVARDEIDYPLQKVRVDGGVCQNDFVLQLLADLLQLPLEKPKELDRTVFGAIYVAGLASGFWQSRDEIQVFWELDKKFLPKDESPENTQVYKTWQNAVERSLMWYKQDIPQSK